MERDILVELEDRTCPFCSHEYKRDKYGSSRGDSVCPICRRRSSTHEHIIGNRLSKMVGTIIKHCSLCGDAFYGCRSSDRYCSKYCSTKAQMIKTSSYNRGLGSLHLLPNVFGNTLVDYHHVNDLAIIPLPTVVHRLEMNSRNIKKHRHQCNDWIEYFYGLDIEKIFSGV